MSTFTPRIERSHRSSIAIVINRKGEVVVKAPRFMPEFFINKFVASKQDWIEKTLEKVNAKKAPQKKYAPGEKFLYLGNEYKLNIGKFREISVTKTLDFPEFLLFRIEKELHNWYVRKAKEVITARVRVRSKEMNTEHTGLRFSDTSSKWGTCFPDNSLQFNWRLIMAPIIVLDYVVIHELAHTIHKNHGEKFWKLVEGHTPAFKTHRKWLNKYAHLLNF